MSEIEVPHIAKDAIIPVNIGPGYLQRLHKLLLFLIEDKTPEELKSLEDNIKTNTIPEDNWQYHFHTIQVFVSMVEQIAIDKKLTIMKKV